MVDCFVTVAGQRTKLLKLTAPTAQLSLMPSDLPRRFASEEECNISLFCSVLNPVLHMEIKPYGMTQTR